jgi:alpha-D-ribose 1-methylphosphonate 5-triphosphate synthase subunit PhnH
LATSPAASYLRFHCGAPLTADPSLARFGIVTAAADMPRLANFGLGDDKYPDRSTTLVLQVASFRDGPDTRWTGPGINGALDLRIAGLPDWFWEDWQVNHELYPMGIDVIFATTNELLGLPRGIKVEV